MIVGDANLSEVATFLKVGVTALVLAMIEDGFLRPRPEAGPARRGHRAVSHDTTLRTRVELVSGGEMTALELQWELTIWPGSTRAEGLEALGSEEVASASSTAGSLSCTGLENDPQSLAGQMDWVAKLRLWRPTSSATTSTGPTRRLAGIDLQYHDLRPSKSLFAAPFHGEADQRRGGCPGHNGPA